jgi:hypothetical protein
MSSTILIVGALLFLFFLMSCVALIDINRKDFGSSEKKTIWGYAATFPVIGPIVYFAIGSKKGKRVQPAKSK